MLATSLHVSRFLPLFTTSRQQVKGPSPSSLCSLAVISLRIPWDRGSDRNRRASGYPQEAQRAGQAFWSGPPHQRMCLFAKRCGPLNKRKERSHGSGKLPTHSLFPRSDSAVSSSSPSFTAAGIAKRRYSWRTSTSTSRLVSNKRCPAPYW